VPADDWIPILLQRLEKDPRRWSGLTRLVLALVRNDQPDIQALLLSTAKARYSAEVRGAALRALVKSDFELKNESTVALLRSALNGKETALITSAIESLQFHHLDKLPEQTDLFFHPDESVRDSARRVLSRAGGGEEMSKICDILLAVLDNPQRAADHLLAIRAINRGINHSPYRPFHHKKKAVVDQLQKVLVHGKSDLLPETLTLLLKLTVKSYQSLIRQVDSLVSEQRRKELAEAVEAM